MSRSLHEPRVESWIIRCRGGRRRSNLERESDENELLLEMAENKIEW